MRLHVKRRNILTDLIEMNLMRNQSTIDELYLCTEMLNEL